MTAGSSCISRHGGRRKYKGKQIKTNKKEPEKKQNVSEIILDSDYEKS